jgi:hypothetical protein
MKGILISGLPTPITKTFPPNFAAWMAPLMEDSTPVHSITTAGSTPEASETTFLANCSGVDVGDNNGLGACGFHASESHQTDRASAADQHAVAQSDVCTLHACEGHAERLEQRAVFVGHVADLVAPDGRVVDVAAQQAGDGRRAAELDADAAVIFSCQAGLALAADDVGLDGDAVADAVSGDGGVFGDDYAGGLVA